MPICRENVPEAKNPLLAGSAKKKCPCAGLSPCVEIVQGGLGGSPCGGGTPRESPENAPEGLSPFFPASCGFFVAPFSPAHGGFLSGMCRLAGFSTGASDNPPC